MYIAIIVSLWPRIAGGYVGGTSDGVQQFNYIPDLFNKLVLG